MQNYPVGTYLVRARVQGGERVGFALSLRTVEDTKHMKAGGATKIHMSVGSIIQTKRTRDVFASDKKYLNCQFFANWKYVF
jgi:hypothetical protein